MYQINLGHRFLFSVVWGDKCLDSKDSMLKDLKNKCGGAPDGCRSGDGDE
jgi:hypothetical protein